MRALDRIFRRRAVSQAIKKLVAWTPASLFANNEPGAYFDPNNSATLFEDTAGTIPTALERPVGLMLDLSKGLVLGPELVPDGTQWTAVAPTTSSWTPSTSTLRVTGGISGGAYYNYPATAGTIYKATFTVSVVSAGTWYVIAKAEVNAGSSNLYIASGTTSKKVTFYFTNIFATPSIYIQITKGGVIDVSNISVRELPGNHATSSSTARPTLTRRVNLLSNTEAFDNSSVWNNAGNRISVTSNDTTAPNGTLTADKLIVISDATNPNNAALYQTPAITGKTVTLTAYYKYGNSQWTCLSLSGGASPQRVFFDILNGVKGAEQNGATGTITDVGNGWYLCSITATATADIAVYNAATDADASSAVTPGKYSYIWGADLRPTNFGVGLPVYQRVGDTSVNAADYDTTGFPAWLCCSGGQSMVTPSINFTGTDKMTVLAGVRKLSDYTTQSNAALIAELGPQVDLNNGSWALVGSIGYNTGKKYDFNSKGTSAYVSAGTTSSLFSAPITNVISCLSDLNGSTSDYARLRINGVQIAEDVTSQGNGPFGSYPINLFSRSQSSFFFNGLAGPIIVRGAQSSAAEIANAEDWINAQQKVYQPATPIFNALDSSGVSYSINNQVLDSLGSTYTITASVLDSAGTSYNLI